MLRMTLILCVGMYAALMIAGADRGLYLDAKLGANETVVTAVEEPIFSLASVGNEAVPAAPEVPDGGEGTIWYVNASSVNVRAAPSTEAEVVGRLGSGEATLLVQTVDDDWARIVIQGDGVEGFVALRYLSAEAP